jgi:hypothetical protein
MLAPAIKRSLIARTESAFAKPATEWTPGERAAVRALTVPTIASTIQSSVAPRHTRTLRVAGEPDDDDDPDDEEGEDDPDEDEGDDIEDDGEQVCEECGAENPADANYCGQCGAPLEATDDEELEPEDAGDDEEEDDQRRDRPDVDESLVARIAENNPGIDPSKIRASLAAIGRTSSTLGNGSLNDPITLEYVRRRTAELSPRTVARVPMARRVSDAEVAATVARTGLDPTKVRESLEFIVDNPSSK